MKSIDKNVKGSKGQAQGKNIYSTTASEVAETGGFDPNTGSKLIQPQGVFSDEDLKELGMTREDYDARR